MTLQEILSDIQLTLTAIEPLLPQGTPEAADSIALHLTILVEDALAAYQTHVGSAYDLTQIPNEDPIA